MLKGGHVGFRVFLITYHMCSGVGSEAHNKSSWPTIVL